MSILSRADAPIAIFDSGLGGLSVARHIRARLPHESLIYFADCGWAPYGDRPRQDILDRVGVVADWLVAQGVKSLVVACNTATTIAIDTLRVRYDTLPIVGIEPGLKPAVARSRSHVVGVLATEATLRTESFQALLARQGSACRFVCRAGRGLVALIEQGALDTPAVDTLLLHYLDPMLADGVDTLVLGSTHFPLLIPAIERLYGNRLALIETGQAVAQRLQAVLDTHALLAVEPWASGARLRRPLHSGGDRPWVASAGHEGQARADTPGDGPVTGDMMGRIRLVSSRPSPALLVLAGQTLGATRPLEIALD